VAKERARELADLVPEGAFIALAPFIGGEAAAEIIGAAGEPTSNGNSHRAPAAKKRNGRSR
jgi:hypothetical protein